MARGDIEVVYSRERGWHLTIQGGFDTQEEAWAEANRLGRRIKRETFLRGLSGRWRKRNTHGHDPRDVPN